MAKIKKGEVRNPKGRPKGSKNKISKAILDATLEVIKESPSEELRMLRDQKPDVFWRLAYGLIPKDIDHTLEYSGKTEKKISIGFLESDKDTDK